ncbi:MAG: hypothetical protein H6873_03575 [Hyphomicrobiaceae bacterium]|nr:hypothetical protein [Hyphomicrobiaceae bacterium]
MRAAIAALFAIGLAAPAHGAGNLASLPEHLPDLEINGVDLTLSQQEYHLETGKYYVWSVVSDGIDQYELMAPELMRNSWVDKVVVEETTVRPMGIYSVEMEEEGTIEIWFVPIRPGRFEFWVDGYENRGLAGDFIVE